MSIALVRNPGDDTPYHYFSAVNEQAVSTTETDGVVSVVRLTMRRGDAPPLHTHSREDESWVVLAGRVRIWVGSASLDECDVHDAEAGAYIYGPRHVPHTFQPITTTAEVLVINNPGAVESYFQSVGSADTRRDVENTDLLAQYGPELLDNPPPAKELSGRSCAEPDDEGRRSGGAEEDEAALVIAGGHGPGLLQPVDRPLDGVAFLVPLVVEAGWPSAA